MAFDQDPTAPPPTNLPAGMDKLMADARHVEFELVVCRFDRFAISVRQLVNALAEFKGLGIDFVSHKEALDRSTPIGNVVLKVIAGIENARVIGDDIKEGNLFRAGTNNQSLAGHSIGSEFAEIRQIWLNDE